MKRVVNRLSAVARTQNLLARKSSSHALGVVLGGPWETHDLRKEAGGARHFSDGAKPQCDLYTVTPTTRFENELLDLTGTNLSATTPLDHHLLARIDSMHYMEHQGTSDMLASFDSPPQCILDIGSGFGGCSRYVAGAAASTEAMPRHVTALELQPDISSSAESLTRRCGLSPIITHVRGDAIGDAFLLPREGEYELAFSKLVVCHIPFAVRPRLWERAGRALQPGGVLYLEDFFTMSKFTNDEIVDLEERIGMPSAQELPSREEWVKQLEAAGFRDVAFSDATDEWAPWVTRRAKAYRGDRERNLRVQGELITDGMERFYDTAAKLFNGGRFGGCVIRAVKH
jgi:predicted O-methyltransferase YrrM